jgi:SHS2 domain-containing protein
VSLRWEHFPHGADVGVRGIGASEEEAFAAAASALVAAIADPQRIAPREPVSIACEAPDRELLFVDWLNALVYEMACRGMLFSKFDLRIEGNRLTGTAWGERVDVVRHRPAVEVKGATLTELRVGRSPGGEWIAQCVVDV